MSTETSSGCPDSRVSKEFMRRLPLFADLAEEDLDQLYAMARPLSVSAGERMIEEGTPGDALFIIVDGEVEVSKQEGDRTVVLATRGSGDFVGELSLLEQAPRSASVRALRDSQLLVISRAAFDTLLSCSPSAPLTLLRTVTSRLRSTESLLMQQEKLAALGTLAAGLAHELNNPAAAIRRGSAHLRQTLDEWVTVTAELGSLALDQRQREALRTLRAEAEPEPGPVSQDPLAASEREDAVQEWLESRGVERGWEIAPVLAACGWNQKTLDVLAGTFSAAQLPVVVRWLAAGFTMYELLDEVGRSAEAVSEIVTAVKRYTYRDQAPVQEVDVHASLENTLVILRHRTREGIRIVREYAEDLPHVEAYASELNQVWTNIIDNAIEAMQGRGMLRLRTFAKGEAVVVEITDSGPGIPPDVLPRIFEPFFTTKEATLGTGLGLHTAHNVVVHHHQGEIRVTSAPGETTFQITLPLRQAQDAAAAG